MNTLLTADLHLTDNPNEEYRWNIFDILEKEAIKNDVRLIGLLGDTTDRKDRHSGKLVNKFVRSLTHLQEKTQAAIIVLGGNHDAPLKGTFFWEFLNDYEGVFYFTAPKLWCTQDAHIWMLPFSANPEHEWGAIKWGEGFDAIFMHQPIEGALIDEKRKLEKAPPIPQLPDVPIFSGDIHHQQTLTLNHRDVTNKITYIGVPHPVHYNESWKHRIILIKENDFKNPIEIITEGMQRGILEISNSSDLDSLDYKQGDQLRIRYKLTGQSLTTWPSEEEKIRKWASDKGIFVASVEASIVGEGVQASTTEEHQQMELMSPEEVISKFCTDENLSDDVKKMGVELLKESV